MLTLEQNCQAKVKKLKVMGGGGAVLRRGYRTVSGVKYIVIRNRDIVDAPLIVGAYISPIYSTKYVEHWPVYFIRGFWKIYTE